MSNLITNAIKYSPKDSLVKIRVEIARDPKYVEVTVEDNGIGIAPENQKMIFERFYRIENQVHTIKGTGLGLHLVKVAIEKHHHGKVFVKSALNQGSTFGFWLPLEISTKDYIKQNLNSDLAIKQVNSEEEPENKDKQLVLAQNLPDEKESKKDDSSDWEITFEVRD